MTAPSWRYVYPTCPTDRLELVVTWQGETKTFYLSDILVVSSFKDRDEMARWVMEHWDDGS